MSAGLSRRELLGGAIALTPFLQAKAAGPGPRGVVVETNAHIYSTELFDFHPNRTYTPDPFPLEDYVKHVQEAGIGPVLIVHPTTYQDDHRSVEYYVKNEPSPGFFKGTCFFDPVDPKTPARMKDLADRNPGRFVALRIFENRKASDAPKVPATTPTIVDRDLRDPNFKATWKAAGDTGMGIQMNAIPGHAPQVRALAEQFPNVPLIIDHLSRPQLGTPEEYEHVLKLAELPHAYMKFTSVRGASKEEYPHLDLKPLARRLIDGFGPDRILWGTLGNNVNAFERNAAMFDQIFDFISEADRAKIRGLNAVKLFKFENAEYLKNVKI